MEKWDIVYTSTQEDLYRALKYGDVRRVGTAGRIVETVVLGPAGGLVYRALFRTGDRSARQPAAGIGRPLPSGRAVAGAGMAGPGCVAAGSAGPAPPTRLRVYDEGLRYGQAEELHAFGTEHVTALPGLFILRYGRELVPLPHRALPPDCLAFLRGKWEEPSDPLDGAAL